MNGSEKEKKIKDIEMEFGRKSKPKQIDEKEHFR